jgi:acetate kinase
MKILILNSGSSSIKFKVFDMPEEKVICSGFAERIGLKNSKLHYKSSKYNIDRDMKISNHRDGLEKIAGYLLDQKAGVLQSASEISVVGHRVVHGGMSFSKTTEITQNVKDKIRALFSLAPLHNPANLEGIEVSELIFPEAKQIAVFDTAFHQTLAKKAYTYAIPIRFLKENNIRKYGFHGTSHKFVSEQANRYLGMKSSKIIVIHLGNGCSISAIKNGKSVDTTLGFGPVTGLIMGTRSGSIDHSIIFYLAQKFGYSLDEINKILQNESGMLGLTGFSDLRDIQAEAEKGNEDCKLALEMNAYRIKKYIGSFATIMNGLDAIVFTAGIGENSSLMRSLVCSDMDFLGIELDEVRNISNSNMIAEIHSEKSKVSVLVVPTNEELEIAKQSFQLISQKSD